ncbi:MAG: hypothetical protein AAGF24_00885 [Cyanobacteria bacterium P01_H01_bin.121]
MITKPYYAIRARQTGRYLTASDPDTVAQYLLLFREDFEARSYLTTHAQDLKAQFTIEYLSQNAIAPILGRWDLQGIGIVIDPLIPTIQFLQ